MVMKKYEIYPLGTMNKGPTNHNEPISQQGNS